MVASVSLRPVGLGLALALLPAAAAADGPLAPVGRERQVNTATAGFQLAPEVASPGEGAFVVTWYTSPALPGPCTVQARAFRAGGVAATPGDALLADCYTNPARSVPVAWRALDEDPLLVWQVDGYRQQLGVAPYLPAAGALGTTTEALGTESFGVVGTAAGFVVAGAVFTPAPVGYAVTRLFSPDGEPVGAEVTALPPVLGRFRYGLRLAENGTGQGAWLLWKQEEEEAPEVVELRLTRIASDGTAVGAEQQVAAPAASAQREAAGLAADPLGGSLLAVWQDETVDAEIRARALDADGAPVGAELAINSYSTGVQSSPDVAAVGDGSFLVVWDSQGSPGDDSFSTSVQGQRVDTDGAPLGVAFQINTITTQAQRTPRVAAIGDGRLIVAWSSDESGGDDASHTSIQARVVGPRVFDDGFESGDAEAWTGGGTLP